MLFKQNICNKIENVLRTGIESEKSVNRLYEKEKKSFKNKGEKNMNRVVLIGRLTRDVDVRYTQGAEPTAIARYTLAINRAHKQDGGQEADFIPCIAFGKTAKLAEQYLEKGRRVAVEGRIQTGNYTNKQGQKVYPTEVVVERQEFLEKKAANSQPDANAIENHADQFMDIPYNIDDELPFN